MTDYDQSAIVHLIGYIRLPRQQHRSLRRRLLLVTKTGTITSRSRIENNDLTLYLVY